MQAGERLRAQVLNGLELRRPLPDSVSAFPGPGAKMPGGIENRRPFGRRWRRVGFATKPSRAKISRQRPSPTTLPDAIQEFCKRQPSAAPQSVRLRIQQTMKNGSQARLLPFQPGATDDPIQCELARDSYVSVTARRLMLSCRAPFQATAWPGQEHLGFSGSV